MERCLGRCCPLWDGKGCGGSQKVEIAKLDEMGWEYEEVDVTRFLAREFQVGDLIEALDPENVFCAATILEAPKPPAGLTGPLDLKWQVECKKTKKRFTSSCVRHQFDPVSPTG